MEDEYKGLAKIIEKAISPSKSNLEMIAPVEMHATFVLRARSKEPYNGLQRGISVTIFNYEYHNPSYKLLIWAGADHGRRYAHELVSSFQNITKEELEKSEFLMKVENSIKEAVQQAESYQLKDLIWEYRVNIPWRYNPKFI